MAGTAVRVGKAQELGAQAEILTACRRGNQIEEVRRMNLPKWPVELPQTYDIVSETTYLQIFVNLCTRRVTFSNQRTLTPAIRSSRLENQ